MIPANAAPLAEGTGLPWDVAVGDAVQTIAEARAGLGDTFVVNSGKDHYLFTFSPPASSRSTDSPRTRRARESPTS